MINYPSLLLHSDDHVHDWRTPSHTRHNHTYTDSHLHMLDARNFENVCNTPSSFFFSFFFAAFIDSLGGADGEEPEQGRTSGDDATSEEAFVPELDCSSEEEDYLSLAREIRRQEQPLATRRSSVDSLGGAVDEELEQERAGGEDASREEEFVPESDCSPEEEVYLSLARQIRRRKQPVATRRSSEEADSENGAHTVVAKDCSV